MGGEEVQGGVRGCGDGGEEGRRLSQGGGCPGQALKPISTLTCVPAEADTQPPPAQLRVVSLGEPEIPTFPSKGQQGSGTHSRTTHTRGPDPSGAGVRKTAPAPPVLEPLPLPGAPWRSPRPPRPRLQGLSFCMKGTGCRYDQGPRLAVRTGWPHEKPGSGQHAYCPGRRQSCTGPTGFQPAGTEAGPRGAPPMCPPRSREEKAS